MSGEWIKMRSSLGTHPKVLRIAARIGELPAGHMAPGFNGPLLELVSRDVTRDITVSTLLRVWCATNEHTVDGKWFGVTLLDIDSVAGVPGFAAAMMEVGWLQDDGESMTLCNFLEWNAPGKDGARSSAATRQKAYRDRQKSNVTRDVTRDVTSNAREEKRREEKKEKKEKKERPAGLSKETEIVTNGHDPLGDAPKRATKRCPSDFFVTEALRSEIAVDCPGIDFGFETKAFRDHEFKTAHSDWAAVWRNWMREAFKRLPPSAKSAPYRGKTL